MPSRTEFESDPQGRKYADVLNDPALDFDAVLAFLDDPSRRRRMVEAEAIHGRPALAGVVQELESLPQVDRFFQTRSGHDTRRFRQAVGVAVRLVMEDLAWRRTGVKGALGRRAPVPAGTAAPGAYQNVPGSTSRWFTRAEHYRPLHAGLTGPEVLPGEAPPEDAAARLARLRIGLAELAQIGSETERRETLDALWTGLEATRHAEGRAFRWRGSSSSTPAPSAS